MARGGPVRVRLERVAKPNGGSRLLATLDARDATAYDRAVGAVVGPVEGSLTGSVLAERVWGRGTIASARVRLEPWRPARRRFLRASAALGAEPGGVLIVADVRECYASLSAPVIERSLRLAGCDRTDIRRVARMIDRFEAAGVPGLPVGPAASAVLANAVLSVVDRAIRTRGFTHLRWVDDVVLAAPERSVGEALELVGDALRDLGLRLHDGKTRVLSGAGFGGLEPSRSGGVPLP